MSIRIVRNDAGNCINFYGTSNPTYWNACLSASIDENFPDRINVRNDIRTAEEGTDVFEFFQIPFSDFTDRDDNPFESASETAQYITDNANVSGDTGTFIFSETDTLDAQRESTDTTVLFSNGDIYAVNSLRALDATDGTITIRTVRGDKDVYTKVRYYNVTVNDGAVSFNTIDAAVNRLNEVLSGSVVGTDSGTVSSGSSFTSAPVTFEVYGDRIVATGAGTSLGYESTSEVVNGVTNFDTSNGILSIESISDPGDYFEFDQLNGDWSQTQGLTFGLFDETTYDRSDLESDAAGNAVKSLLRLRVKNSPFIFKDPASTFGKINEKGLSNQLDTRTKFRVGLDSDRRGFISMQLDDGTFQNVGRTETAITSGTDLKFMAIFPLANRLDGIRNMTVNTINDLQPTLTWYYIESPDNSFYYPLFASESEADHVDEVYGTAGIGSGGSHTHIFPDEDPTPNTWYMPDTYMFHAQSAAPTLTGVFYNEIPTEADSGYIPSNLTLNDQSWAENYGVNLQIVPAGADPATVTGLPPGLTYNNGFITGTTPYVPENTTYTVTVVRSNSFGSNTQTFTMTVQDNTSLGNLAGFTELDGNYLQPNRVILTHDAVLQYDTQINPGEDLTYSYSSGYNPPTIGILSGIGTTNFANYNSSTDTLGVSPYDFAQTNQWDLRYVSFGGDIGAGNVRHNLVGWTTDVSINGASGINNDVEFKLRYQSDGYFKLYRGDVEVLSSGSTFSGPQTLTFAGFDDQTQSDLYIPSNLNITVSGAGSSTPPSGFGDPLLAGVMANLSVLGVGGTSTDSAVVEVTQTLAVNHRYVIPQTWIESNVLPYIAGGAASSSNDKQWLFGVPLLNPSYGSFDVSDFYVNFRIEGSSNGNVSGAFINGTAANYINIGSATDSYYEYGIEWDGTTVHLIRCNTNDLNTTPSIADGGTFVSVYSLTMPAYVGQPLPLVMGVRNGGQLNLTTSGLNHIRTPFGTQTILAGENSNGTGDFKINPSNTDYDSVPNGHAPEDFTFADVTTLNAGSTYKFIYHPSMEADDYLEFRLASDGTTVYNTGITTFGGNIDPTTTSVYKGVNVAIATDAPPLQLYHYNSYQSGSFDNGAQRPIAISGSTYTVGINSVSLLGPSGVISGNTLTGNGWLELDQPLDAGNRLVISGSLIREIADSLADYEGLSIGLKANNFNVNNPNLNSNSFVGGYIKIYKQGPLGTQAILKPFSGGTTQVSIDSGDISTSHSMFIDLTSSGNNIRFGFSKTNANQATTTAYSEWTGSNAFKQQTGDQGYGLTSEDIVFLFQGGNGSVFDAADVTWSNFNEIGVPVPPATLTTSWNKALDFSGSSERVQQVNSSNLYTPLKMASQSSQVALPVVTTNTVNSGYPWATACVFKHDGHNSNQHVWNLGEGAGSSDDNIYLRLDSSQRLFFGWGRSGALNECLIHTLSTAWWYGIYVGFNGARYGSAGTTTSRLDQIFDIRLMSSIDSFASISTMTQLQSGWTHGASSSGGRMDREFAGEFTIGGRGSNRNFHGKVASMVTTTLRCGQPMPNDTEISMMIRDPQQWLIDYKAGDPYRRPTSTSDTSNFTLGTSDATYSTQVWLMGDSPNDAFAQIRNYTWTGEQNRTPLNMLSMVANDIETVNIPGLT